MIRFKKSDSTAKVTEVSFESIIEEFMGHPISHEQRDFVVNMMVFLDEKEKREGLKFQRLESEDWHNLFAAYNKRMLIPETTEV